MRSKTSLKSFLFLCGIFLIAFFSVVVLFMAPDLLVRGSYTKPAATGDGQNLQNAVSGDVVASGQNTALLEKAGHPVRLKIPKIKVNAVVETAGLTPDGAMGVPKGPYNVAWFKLGPRPGNTGSAVIAGHYGFKRGSVFDNLNKLQKGDKIYIEDDKGATIAFVVREIKTYTSDAGASEVFNSGDSTSRLNLITCEGTWNKVTKNYSRRRVVFADKEQGF
jgi:LPXTG-site transpeptidase (sortase) family protein